MGFPRVVRVRVNACTQAPGIVRMSPGSLIHVIYRDSSVRDRIAVRAQNSGHRAALFETPTQFLLMHEAPLQGCVVMEMEHPELSGIEFLERLRHRMIALPVILMTQRAQLSTAVEAMKKGAFTLLAVPFDDVELCKAINEAVDQEERTRSKKVEQAEIRERIGSLSEKERKVMDLVVQGVANKVIAKRLKVSVRTVESRRHLVFEKMQVASLAQLVRAALLCELSQEPVAPVRYQASSVVGDTSGTVT